MKIMDEKGRLFGKVNVIDFLIILFLFCLTPMFYFGYKIMTKQPIEPKKDFTQLEIDCQIIKLKPELLEIIAVGDQELDTYGQVIGEIISLGQSKPYKYELDIGASQKITKEDPILKQLKAKVKLKAEIKEDRLYYKDKPIRVGLLLEFNSNKYSIVAIPTITTATEVIVKAKFINLMPDLSKIVKIDDRQIETIGPNIKKIIAKITRIISNEPAEFIRLMPQGGKWSITGHPKNRDLVLEIEILCLRKPQGLFLLNQPIKIGKPFGFTTDSYSISGTIIGIEEK